MNVMKNLMTMYALASAVCKGGKTKRVNMWSA